MKTIRLPHNALEWIYVPDVKYHEYPCGARSMQMLIPYIADQQQAQIRFPLIVFIPGSAWYRQEMYNSIPSYAKLAEMGFIVAAVQYRESTLAKFPAQVEDVERAIQFLSAKAEEFHIDPHQIYLAGNSSGGHIALLTALRLANGIKDAENCDVAIKGIVAESAQSSMLLGASATPRHNVPGDFMPVEDLLGVVNRFDDIPLAESASCEMYIKKDAALPPILLIHGSLDPIVDTEQSRVLYSQLLQAGKQADYYEIDGAGHGGSVFWSNEVLQIIADFISKT